MDSYINNSGDLDNEWEVALADMQNTDLFDQMMNLATNQPPNKDSQYKFSDTSAFDQVQDVLQTAKQLFNDGRTTQAIIAAEAHLKKEPKDGSSWKLLGQMHAENDQDEKALQCLTKAKENDPEDRETQLLLAIALTNEMDYINACQTLWKWFTTNPKYGSFELPDDVKQPLENAPTQETLDETIQALIKAIEKLIESESQDTQLLSALAVLNFIKKNYQLAVKIFVKSLQVNPKDYMMWNKLGATLQHFNKSIEAMFCYKRALFLKPDIVRTVTNVGVAYLSMQKCEDAIRFFAQALKLNPQADHLWCYIQSSVYQHNKEEIIVLVANKDLPQLLQLFPSYSPTARDNESYNNQAAEKWLQEFKE